MTAEEREVEMERLYRYMVALEAKNIMLYIRTLGLGSSRMQKQ